MNDNTGLKAKIELRACIMGELKARICKERLNILEFCTGEKRHIYKNLYQEMNTISCDRKKIPGVIQSDALKYIKRHDLEGIEYFDIDTYGTPYIIMLNVLFKLKPGIYGFALTDGQFGTSSTGAAQSREKLLRLALNNLRGITIPALSRHHEYLTKRTLSIIAHSFDIEYDLIKYAHVNRMSYIGIILKKLE